MPCDLNDNLPVKRFNHDIEELSSSQCSEASASHEDLDDEVGSKASEEQLVDIVVYSCNGCGQGFQEGQLRQECTICKEFDYCETCARDNPHPHLMTEHIHSNEDTEKLEIISEYRESDEADQDPNEDHPTSSFIDDEAEENNDDDSVEEDEEISSQDSLHDFIADDCDVQEELISASKSDFDYLAKKRKFTIDDIDGGEDPEAKDLQEYTQQVLTAHASANSKFKRLYKEKQREPGLDDQSPGEEDGETEIAPRRGAKEGIITTTVTIESFFSRWKKQTQDDAALPQEEIGESEEGASLPRKRAALKHCLNEEEDPL